MAKDLGKISREELGEWLDSFDNILFDCDGVILDEKNVPIPGAMKSLDALKSLGKNTRLVTNNSFRTPEQWERSVLCEHFALHDIVYPIKAAVNYLKKEKFSKKAFVFGMESVKKALVDAGIEIFDIKVKTEHVKFHEIKNISELLGDDESVGAVIVDFDINLNYMQLLKAAVILKRPDVHFICCATDKTFQTSFGARIDINYIGPFYLVQALEASSGRKCKAFGKPGVELKTYLEEEFDCCPGRTLFVGDSLDTDMPFANLCGFQKLLVLTGQTTIENLANCSEEIRPEYYANSLGDLHEILKGPHTKI